MMWEFRDSNGNGLEVGGLLDRQTHHFIYIQRCTPITLYPKAPLYNIIII